jgi:hypothetical protein
MYLDTGCTYREEFAGGKHTYTFTGRCTVTGEMISVIVNAPELFKLRQGTLMQNALVSNTPAEREFLLTGVSAEGWRILFPPRYED